MGSDSTKERAPLQSFMARLYPGIWGSLLYAWVLVQTLVVQFERLGIIYGQPYLLPSFLTVTVILAGFVIGWDALYWYASGRKRKADEDYNKRLDHSIRGHIDQWISTAVLACYGYILLALLIFYFQQNGVQDFTSLSLAPSGPELARYSIIMSLHDYVITAGFAIAIVVLCTTTDMFKRFATDLYREKMELVDGTPQMTGVTAPSASTRATRAVTFSDPVAFFFS